MGDIKDKVKSLFKTIPTKNYSKPIRISNVYGGQKKPRKPKMKKQSEDKIIKVVEYRVIKDIKNLLTNNSSICNYDSLSWISSTEPLAI